MRVRVVPEKPWGQLSWGPLCVFAETQKYFVATFGVDLHGYPLHLPLTYSTQWAPLEVRHWQHSGRLRNSASSGAVAEQMQETDDPCCKIGSCS